MSAALIKRQKNNWNHLLQKLLVFFIRRMMGNMLFKMTLI